MKKSYISIGLVLLLLFQMLSMISPVQGGSGDIIYVDDDNTTPPWNGTIEHPYQNIRDAIENASEGDTIFVFAGTYYNWLWIDMRLTLSGQDRNTTIIDGSHHTDSNVIIYYVDGVEISGFTIRNATNAKDGITITTSSYNMISGNNIQNNDGTGISISQFSYNNTISDNRIYDNGMGITCNGSNNIITDNVIEDN